MSETTPAPREGQTFVGGSLLVRYANFVKLPHTVFALPFALVGATLASRHYPLRAATVAWVVLAFTAARFAAMAFNRIVDRDVDARNPRTRERELPRGALTLAEAWTGVIASVMLFVFAAWMLNPLCFALSPVAVAWVFFYSYTKRFTRWSHIVLGAGLSIAPVGGYLALAGRWSDPWWLLPVLALGVTTWVAGFDVLYALADEDFDRANGLHSLPAAVGKRRAISASRVMHVITVMSLGAAGLAAQAGVLYFVGVGVAAALLLWEHRLVDADDLTRLDAAFFTMNGVISIAFFCFVLAERLLS